MTTNQNMLGLTEQDIEWIKEAAGKLPEIEELIIFGSRALGNYKKASDIDICVKGTDVNSSIILKLRGMLENNYPTPYFFDIINYSEIKNHDLIKHIDNEGITLFKINIGQ